MRITAWNLNLRVLWTCKFSLHVSFHYHQLFYSLFENEKNWFMVSIFTVFTKTKNYLWSKFKYISCGSTYVELGLLYILLILLRTKKIKTAIKLFQKSELWTQENNGKARKYWEYLITTAKRCQHYNIGETWYTMN